MRVLGSSYVGLGERQRREEVVLHSVHLANDLLKDFLVPRHIHHFYLSDTSHTHTHTVTTTFFSQRFFFINRCLVSHAVDFSLRSSWRDAGWLPSVASDHCLFGLWIVLLFVVRYCTINTQIYDHNCYRFGWLFILPSLVSLWLTWFRNSHHRIKTGWPETKTKHIYPLIG